MNRPYLVACAALGLAGLLPAGCSSLAERQAYEDLSREESSMNYAPAGAADAPLEELTERSTLEDYVRYAALNNPGLEAAFHRWAAALERVPQARSLSDPRLTYRYYIEEVETRVGPQRQSVGITQMFPWFGKLGLRAGAALEAANVSRRQYEAEKWKLFHRVRSAYAEYYYFGRALDVVRQNYELMKQLEEVARSRYTVGSAEHRDVIRAQVELGKLDDRLRSLVELRAPIAARLNAALNRPENAEAPIPAELPQEPVRASDDEVMIWLTEASPELQALEHEIAKEQKGLALAQKDYYPDITLGLDYIDTGSARMPGVSGSGKDPVIAMISINLPIWYGKYRAEEREARARIRAASKTKAERENTLEANGRMLLYKLHDAERKISLYRDTLIPKALESLKANETAFRAGKASFLDLIDSERILLEFQLSVERALADRLQALAELEALAGRALTQEPAEAVEQQSHEAAASEAAGPEQPAEAEWWTCSMHPQVRRPQAGQCPICGMDLIKEASE